MEVVNKTGRRKTAVARVFVSPEGSGKVIVNKKDYKEYFTTIVQREQIEQPLKLTQTIDKMDIMVNAHGGGVKGQSEAVKLGIARALCVINPEYKPILKQHGLLTRNPRMVERKKFGQKKARKKFQFSKR